MRRIKDSCYKVATCTEDLLNYITDAACDGSFNAGERSEIEGKIAATKLAVAKLAQDFQDARGRGSGINESIFGECFFVVSLSAYARLVWEYGEIMLKNPPQGTSFGADMIGAIKATWDLKALTEPMNMNFTIKHFIAIFLCWMYSLCG